MARRSGVLLSLTSLPSRFGIGDLGPEAARFAEFLKKAGQKFWQVLPLSVLDGGAGNSPYSPLSAFAGNPLLISPEMLVSTGLLDQENLKGIPDCTPGRIDYELVREIKDPILRLAYSNFKKFGQSSEYECFFKENRYWLEPYSFFAAIRECSDEKCWYNWPEALKFRHHEALHRYWEEHQDEIEYHRFVQYIFHEQMGVFRDCLEQFDLELVGDMPIYVTLNSADVWANPHLFELDENLSPTSIAGVPPDYYSETGQLWGNPLYRWDVMQNDGFQWWMSRFRHLFSFFDKIRIDHFRGLIGYWALPADAKTAEKGCWRSVPHERFFEALAWHFPERPFWAENLGVLTSEIEAARKGLGLPGMLVLHFAFTDPAHNLYAPHNHTPDNVVYTGTHDNNTTLGWFRKEGTPKEISNLILYLGKEVSAESICDDMIRMAMASVAETAVIPMQDYLGLGELSRINIPSKPYGNWEWRMCHGQTTDELAGRIFTLSQIYGRLAPESLSA